MMDDETELVTSTHTVAPFSNNDDDDASIVDVDACITRLTIFPIFHSGKIYLFSRSTMVAQSTAIDTFYLRLEKPNSYSSSRD